MIFKHGVQWTIARRACSPAVRAVDRPVEDVGSSPGCCRGARSASGIYVWVYWCGTMALARLGGKGDG